ncbi:hypothetical protein SAMD00019534_064080 [Acytostelium subglobosum LB1]|uniref:hypothetical protein n=1 Tax=Acytostelium subglobosum LB1 TaxID=1410327 RepID=UPI000644C880|nr:hypothetical protein SAMD00019534_064080 [Acytostelium subglobosum LB1]GAM23233.1 hypothetical protein SAMD00019534_064080 [Acytostelium subglobosum LB1]|eukprot:XP_012753682.1 hypothetical protein SAMD00019534_064080 [Acytostelium subglobosum LB1]
MTKNTKIATLASLASLSSQSSSSSSSQTTSTSDQKGNGKGKLNVLLTGATGFVGSNCLRPMLDSNQYRVFALVRNRHKVDGSTQSRQMPKEFRQFSSNPSFSILVGDIVDLDLDAAHQGKVIEHLRKLIISHRIHIIVHLAAAMEFYPGDQHIVYMTNVIGTKNLLEASIYRKHKGGGDGDGSDSDSDSEESEQDSDDSDGEALPKVVDHPLIKRFIYISSTEAMGGCPPSPGVLRSETSRDNPPNFYYGETKLQGEEHVRATEQDYGLDTMIVRLTGVFGRSDDFSMFELIQAISYGLIFFIPSFATGSVMYTHIDDVVHGIMLAMKKKRSSLDVSNKSDLPYTYIIAPDKGLSYREVIIYINEKLNRMKPRLVLPGVIVQGAIGLVGKLIYRFKNKQFLFQPKTLERMSEDRMFNNERAKRELGFKPQYTFKQGLNVTIEEYLENDRISYYPVSPLFIGFIMLILFIKFMSWDMF